MSVFDDAVERARRAPRPTFGVRPEEHFQEGLRVYKALLVDVVDNLKRRGVPMMPIYVGQEDGWGSVTGYRLSNREAWPLQIFALRPDGVTYEYTDPRCQRPGTTPTPAPGLMIRELRTKYGSSSRGSLRFDENSELMWDVNMEFNAREMQLNDFDRRIQVHPRWYGHGMPLVELLGMAVADLVDQR